MFVVYESPFQMVADSPDVYENAAGFDIVKMVPTSWDETRFLAGEIDDYVGSRAARARTVHRRDGE
jgi:alpha-glucosidase